MNIRQHSFTLWGGNMDFDYSNAFMKASEYRRKARAWERAANAIIKANRALVKAQELDDQSDKNKVVKKIGNW